MDGVYNLSECLVSNFWLEPYIHTVGVCAAGASILLFKHLNKEDFPALCGISALAGIYIAALSFSMPIRNNQMGYFLEKISPCQKEIQVIDGGYEVAVAAAFIATLSVCYTLVFKSAERFLARGQ